MDRRFVVSALITLAAMPAVAGIVAIVMAWCLHQWNTPLWQLGVAGFSLVFVSSYVVWRIARNLASGRFAFSIRAMLISMAIIAVLLSTVGRWFLGTYRQHQAIRSVAVRGGGVLNVGDVHASDPRIWFYRWIGMDQGHLQDRSRVLSPSGPSHGQLQLHNPV